MTKRSNITLALGVAVFVVGAGAAYLTSQDGGARAGAGEPKVSVLYAEGPIVAGTTGANAVNQGLVKARSVAPRSRPPNALTDISQLAGKTSAADIAKGRVLTEAEFPASQTRIGTVRIPPGKTALAVQMANVPGVAGFAGAGDRIDLYGVAKHGGAGGAGGARLVMQGIEILNVNGTALAPNPGQPGGPGMVFLLAVTPVEAERLVYLTTFEQLYFSLVPKDHVRVPSTPGAGPGDALKAA